METTAAREEVARRACRGGAPALPYASTSAGAENSEVKAASSVHRRGIFLYGWW